jgi:proline iminopeptidase
MRRFLRRLFAAAAFVAVAAAVVRWFELRKKNYGSTPEEQRRPLPGDEFVHELATETTNAITIEAPPEAVWPWLIQMGYDRAGWYTSVSVERRDPVAEEIIPEFQDVEAGYVLTLDPKGTVGLPVLRVDPEEALVLGSPVDPATREPAKMPGDVSLTWSFHLEPLFGDRTRLITRVRGGDAAQRSKAQLPVKLIFDLVHPIMQMKQLQAIKERAERTYQREQEQQAAPQAS